MYNFKNSKSINNIVKKWEITGYIPDNSDNKEIISLALEFATQYLLIKMDYDENNDFDDKLVELSLPAIVRIFRDVRIYIPYDMIIINVIEIVNKLNSNLKAIKAESQLHNPYIDIEALFLASFCDNYKLKYESYYE